MSLTLNDIDGLVRRLFDRASRVQPMSRLDSRQLDELVQATVDLQNRPREERRMRTVEFTAHVDECELAGLDSVTRAQIIESRWRELYLRMANHIAENLSANQYQLLRVVSDSGRNAIYSNRVVTMTLTLEVGQVTERPFVNVSVGPEHIHEDYRRGSRVPTESEFLNPVPHKRHILIDKKNTTPENTP